MIEMLQENEGLSTFLTIILILICGIAAWLATRHFLKSLTKRLQAIDGKDDSDFDLRVKTVMRFVRSGSLIFIIFATIFFLLQVVNIDITPLLTSVGIAGLAVSVGAQTLIEDALAGCSFMVEGQFKVGDSIKVGDIKGEVTDISLRNTHLREVDGTLHIIPNGEIRIVTNMAAGWSRARLDILVPYSESIDKAEAYIMDNLKILNEDPKLKKLIEGDFRLVGPEDLTEHGSRFRLLARVSPGEQGKVERAMRRNLLHLFQLHGIRMANATQEIILYTPPNEVINIANDEKKVGQSKVDKEDQKKKNDVNRKKKMEAKNIDSPKAKKIKTENVTDVVTKKLTSK